jgi:23S rRNA (guanosine2251-2'-O)-methyltransferase
LQKARAAARNVKKSNLEVIYGRNAVLEALRAGIPASRLVFAEGADHDDRTKEIIALANTAAVQIYESPRAELDAITKGGSHQAVALQIPHYTYYELDALIGAGKNVVILDHITDAGNLGAVCRSTAAFDANIIIPNRRSAEVNATVWKTSAGNLMKTKIAQVTNLTQTIKKLQQAGYYVVGLDGSAAVNVDDKIIREEQKVALVAGSEGSGLAKLVAESCDVLAKIDTAVESLNVAIAVSISLYAIR